MDSMSDMPVVDLKNELLAVIDQDVEMHIDHIKKFLSMKLDNTTSLPPDFIDENLRTFISQLNQSLLQVCNLC